MYRIGQIGLLMSQQTITAILFPYSNQSRSRQGTLDIESTADSVLE